jgi:DNA-binding CsgD family transcriptional regulator
MAPGCTGVKEMVIVNNIDEKNRINVHGLGVNSNRYVYLVDNDEQMMLILKREIEESGNNGTTEEDFAFQEFITDKVHTLAERITGKWPLSPREMEALNYAALGKSNKAIAEVMGLSESTIKNHFSSTLRKLHANDRTHAVTLALCNGWINVKNISCGFPNCRTTVAAATGI